MFKRVRQKSQGENFVKFKKMVFQDPMPRKVMGGGFKK